MGIKILLAIVLLLPSIVSPQTLKTPCMDKEEKLSCLYPRGRWMFTKKGSLKVSPLTQWSRDGPYIFGSLPEQFKDALKINRKNQLIISSFKPKYNGVFICIDDIGSRRAYRLIATQCEAEVCLGDTAIIECPLHGNFNFVTLVWKHGKTTIVTADRYLKTRYVNDSYPWIRLSKVIPRALIVSSMMGDMGTQQFTCVLYGAGGETPRRSTIKLTPKQCINNITVFEDERVDLTCPYQSLLTSHPETIKLVWKKGSRKIATFHVHGQYKSHDESTVAVDGKITLQSVTGHDNGTFTCSVLKQSGVELAKHSVILEVKPLPIKTVKKKGNINDSRAPEGVGGGSNTGSPAFIMIGLLVLVTIFL